MITIKIDTSKSGTEHLIDTYRSLASNASDKNNFEVVRTTHYEDAAFSSSINFVNHPSVNSRVVITLPGDAICLLAKWELYFIYDLDNCKVIDAREVMKRMMLTGHRDSTLVQEITVEYPASGIQEACAGDNDADNSSRDHIDEDDDDSITAGILAAEVATEFLEDLSDNSSAFNDNFSGGGGDFGGGGASGDF